MGKSGRLYVEQNFSRITWAEKFEQMITNIFDKPHKVSLKEENKKVEISA
jgi:hypothetical protein